MNSLANTAFTIDFYANNAADPSAYGEGQSWLGCVSVITNELGDATFDVLLDAPTSAGEVVAATATEDWDVTHALSGETVGNTSEFSNAKVVNTRPVANAGGPYVVSEGMVVPFSAANSSDADAHALQYRWDFDSDGMWDTGWSDDPMAGYAWDDDWAGPVTLQVTDGELVDIDSADVTVNNVAPTAQVEGPSYGARGEPLGFTFNAIDVSPVDQAATFTYQITWGDGAVEEWEGSSLTSVEHVFVDEGQYTVELTAVDKDGGVSAPANTDVQISAAVQKDGTLLVGGTTAPDTISFSAGSVVVEIDEDADGTVDFTQRFVDVDQFVVFGLDGDDRIVVDSAVFVRATMIGGPGNDELTGGGGENVFDGGDGDDVVYGGPGSNLVIGGSGSDSYVPGGGNDEFTIRPGDATPATVAEDGRVAITLLPEVGVDPPDVSFVVTELPSQGVLEYGDVPVCVGDRLPGQSTLAFQPGAAREGAGADTFKFVVSTGVGAEQPSPEATVRIEIVEAVGENQVTIDSSGVVRIGGTSGDDDIVVTHTADGLNLRVIVNAQTQADGIALADVSEVRSWGRAGNDRIEIVDLALMAMIHGGIGDDELIGGAGDDLMFGGAGSDTITGAAGNDFLVGGAGADRLVGSAGHDILAADDVSYSLSRPELWAVLADWVFGEDEDEGTDESLLDESLLTTEDLDKLTGSSGSDWFIINLEDKITDFKSTNKDEDRITYV